MSKTLKWILGITLGFVILAGVGFLAANFFGFGHMSIWGGPAVYGHPMMGGRGFGGFGFLSLPFFFLGGFLRLLFPLAIVALVAYFAYQQGKRAGISAAQSVHAPAPEETNTE